MSLYLYCISTVSPLYLHCISAVSHSGQKNPVWTKRVMTMEGSERELSYVSLRLFKELKLVTYSQVTADLQIPFGKSKQVLFNFYKSNRSKLNASFVIIGTIKNAKQIKYVEGEDNMDKEYELFESVDDVFVYSLSSKEFTFSLKDVVLNQLEIRFTKSFYKLGVIKNDLTKDTRDELKRELSEDAPQKPSQKPSQKEPKTKTPQKSSNIDNWRKRPTSSPAPEAKREKVVSDGLSSISKEQMTKLNSMFDDDFSDEEIIQKPKVAEPNKDAAKTPKQEINKEENHPPAKENPAPENNTPEQPPEVDEDGFVITRAPKKPAKKVAKKQSSLMSFFGKKK